MSGVIKSFNVKCFASHAFIWLLLIAVPFMLAPAVKADYLKITRTTLAPHVFHAIIFYVNYLFLIKVLLNGKKTTVIVLINVFMVAVSVYCLFHIRAYLNNLILPAVRPLGNSAPTAQFLIYRDTVSMIISVFVAIAAGVLTKWSKDESEKKEKENELLNSELQHLKYQLQPHFFFNSLNTVYALIETSPMLAQETVHSLANLMRYLLYETNSNMTRLQKELNFMRQYINLMKLRIPACNVVTVTFCDVPHNMEVAPLLFISLVENAFKHGVSSSVPTQIEFDMQLNRNTIIFRAQNTNLPKNASDKSGRGIGLDNLRKRLYLSYNKKHHLYTENIQGKYCVSLEIKTNFEERRPVLTHDEKNNLPYS